MRFTHTIWLAASLAGAVLALLLVGPLNAQSIVTGGTTGTITDPSGAVVANATVTLKSVATGETQTMKTNSAGAFAFSPLKPGVYTLTVADPGFVTAMTNIQVLLGQITAANTCFAVRRSAKTGEVSAASVSRKRRTS